jgi:hypothetical protein
MPNILTHGTELNENFAAKILLKMQHLYKMNHNTYNYCYMYTVLTC